MITPAPARAPASALPVAVVAAALGLLTVAVISGAAVALAAIALIGLTALALLRIKVVTWRHLLAALVVVILFIPIRRYALPGNLPFELEAYRVLVIAIVVGWGASLLVDRRTRFRGTGFEGPLLLIAFAAVASVVANPVRVTQASSEVQKDLLFFLSILLVIYVIASVVRRPEDIDSVAKALVVGGAIVGCFAIVEARTGFNVFNHLSRVVPVLRSTDLATPEMLKYGAARLRVFGSAQHPIALGALFVLITPLGVYLAIRYSQRRWWLCTTLLIAGCAATISRTAIAMLVVVMIVFIWLRPSHMRRMLPAVIPALIVIKLVLPGTLGAIKQSFFPPGGLVAEQSAKPGEFGSGRIADLGPGLREWGEKPLFGAGYGTRVVEPDTDNPSADILDNQWLGTLLETGAVGLVAWVWFFARFIRRLGGEAKREDSPRGWLLVALTASLAAFAIGMATYDAFSFIQVTLVMFILVGLGSAAMAERPLPAVVVARRRWIRLNGDPTRATT
jgi:O-antigen ligase